MNAAGCLELKQKYLNKKPKDLDNRTNILINSFLHKKFPLIPAPCNFPCLSSSNLSFSELYLRSKNIALGL